MFFLFFFTPCRFCRLRRMALTSVAFSVVVVVGSLLSSLASCCRHSVGFCALSSLSASASLHYCHCLRLVIVVGVLLASTVSFCCRRCELLVVVVSVLSSVSTSCRRCCIAHDGGGVIPHGFLPRLHLLFCCFCHQRFIVVVGKKL